MGAPFHLLKQYGCHLLKQVRCKITKVPTQSQKMSWPSIFFGVSHNTQPTVWPFVLLVFYRALNSHVLLSSPCAQPV